MTTNELENILHHILDTRFSIEELRQHCFDLRIDHDNWPSASKSSMARELILYLERRNQLAELVRVGRRVRADIAWPDITGPVNKVIFDQSFDQPPGFWYTGIMTVDAGTIAREIINGRYIWKVNTDKYDRFRTLPDFPLVSDFEITALLECRVTKGSVGYGLQFARSDHGYCIFELFTEGGSKTRYEQGELFIGFWDSIMNEWKYAQRKPFFESPFGPYLFTVKVKNHILRTKIDNVTMANFKIDHLAAGRMGICIETCETETEAMLEVSRFSLNYELEY